MKENMVIPASEFYCIRISSMLIILIHEMNVMKKTMCNVIVTSRLSICQSVTSDKGVDVKSSDALAD
jgi:hypothetical protein